MRSSASSGSSSRRRSALRSQRSPTPGDHDVGQRAAEHRTGGTRQRRATPSAAVSPVSALLSATDPMARPAARSATSSGGAATLVHERAGQHGGQERTGRDHAAELLEHDGELEEAVALATHRLGEVEPEPAEADEVVPERGQLLGLGVDRGTHDLGRAAARGEPAHRVEQREVVVADGNAHARGVPSPCLTIMSRYSPRRSSLLSMPIHYEQVGEHVVRITIDRPEARNALDLYHFRDLANAWRRFRDDPDDWVAIITGVDGNFMAGADLKTYIPQITELQKQIAAGEVDEIDGCKLRDGTDAVLRSLKIYKPIIAAVDGPCVAGGMEMLGGIDIRIATPRATFGVMEPKRGLFAGGGTTVRLPRQLAFPAAMEFLLTAEAFPAERALELGLLNEIVPADELAERALWWAERITANAPLAVQATKESVLRGLAVDQREAYKIESELAGRSSPAEDAKEGPKAFAEKRDPDWTGT